ncbi:sensor histidine kinase [Streptomyces marispadix]|uniref:histidine kinase n=1 Tax=Streptomyces marispadix TaxID=2922868 RepID=A0ABS9SZJ2_9ACTN|nr:HAMP domain-containing sensor histidine kinase [Streptomyces marispadix]MCH6161695.1 HAMP domain-containing histidine kinase [Streptomyces marispadix]
MKLSTRIALAVGLTVPLLVLAAGWLLFALVAKDVHAEQDAHLRERAAVVKKDARRLLRVTASDRPRAEQVRERRLYAAALDVGIRVVGPYGTFSGGPQPDARTTLPESAPRPVTVRERGKGAPEGMPRKRRVDSWRVLSVPVHGKQPGVEGTLWLFAPDTTGRAQLAFVRRRVTVVALVAAPVSALLAWAAASRASLPLRRLQQRTSGLDPRSGTATATSTASRSDGGTETGGGAAQATSRFEHTPTRITEVDDLAETLRTVLARYDEQAARTAQALATARSFSSAAAHELRTPLMSMQTNLEILSAHPELAGEDRDEVLEDLRREHSRLLGLLVMLRELGQGDLVEADAFGPLDLGEIAEAAVADARRRDRSAAVRLTAAEPGLTVHGWEPGLRSMLDNLIGNALAHGRGRAHDGHGRDAHGRDAHGRDGPGGGGLGHAQVAGGGGPLAPVEVAVRPYASPAGPVAVLTVDDDGPGIPEEQRAAVFQRFKRGPDSSGSGLGLTLVAQQAALHRATVEIRDRPDGLPGTRVEVRVPLAPPEETVPDPGLPAQRDWLIGTAPGAGAGDMAPMAPAPARATAPIPRDARTSTTVPGSQGIHKEGL